MAHTYWNDWSFGWGWFLWFGDCQGITRRRRANRPRLRFYEVRQPAAHHSLDSPNAESFVRVVSQLV